MKLENGCQIVPESPLLIPPVVVISPDYTHEALGKSASYCEVPTPNTPTIQNAFVHNSLEENHSSIFDDISPQRKGENVEKPTPIQILHKDEDIPHYELVSNFNWHEAKSLENGQNNIANNQNEVEVIEDSSESLVESGMGMCSSLKDIRVVECSEGDFKTRKDRWRKIAGFPRLLCSSKKKSPSKLKEQSERLQETSKSVQSVPVVSFLRKEDLPKATERKLAFQTARSEALCSTTTEEDRPSSSNSINHRHSFCEGSCQHVNSECDAIPDPDDRVQTTYKALLRLPEVEDLFIVSEVSEKDEIEDNTMDSKKAIQAPTNPPPPVPNHKYSLSNKSSFSSSGNPNSDKNNFDGLQNLSTELQGETIEKKTDMNTNGAVQVNSSMPLKNIANQNGHYTSAQNAIQQQNCGVLASSKLTTLGKMTAIKAKQNGVESNIPELKLNGFVGFDSLPYQFQFNVLCVGETGMGKTTLIESLFNMKVDFEPCNNELRTVELRTKICEVSEGGVRVKLRIVETAGYGDQLDKDKSAKIIVDYINEQFEAYLKEELKVRRHLAYYDDTRIHVALYFISPTGHGLKALDIVTMKELSKRVNVIPVIAKSDTACKDELVRFKQKIMSEIKSHNIDVYQFPVDDETVRKDNAGLNSLLPFAVVGSTDFVTKEDGRLVRARRYPWGIVEVENEEHCDFVKLREAMLRINEDSLRERTHNILYERYRRERLREMKMKDGDAGFKMVEAFQLRQKEFMEERQKKEEQYNKEFLARVAKKESELKHREEALNVRIRGINESYEGEAKKIEDSINALLDEKAKLENARNSGKKQRK
ncbi:septin domain-containing protein [Ditylenchus destructor]|uniref:Septin domain-containing protein n=1 Tax=Ditylenchus destructor TaxID=166010 RepID=A0AAD4N8A5_9BILA|nr:septin domain-containing protein [Ditylenchus destructor]